MEDAQRLGIIGKREIEELFMGVISALSPADADRTHSRFKSLQDSNEAIAFLRARIINLLANGATTVFLDNRSEILSGNFNDTLLDKIEQQCKALRTVQQVSVERIYGHDSVIQIEIAGYNVMSELLQLFIPALLKPNPSHKEKKVLSLFPFQYTEYLHTENNYEKVLSALDHISGMTDEYATEMYRMLKGITIPQHS
jgi:dGTPase